MRSVKLRERLREDGLAPLLAPGQQSLARRGAVAGHQLAQVRAASVGTLALIVHEAEREQVARHAEVAALPELFPQRRHVGERPGRQLRSLHHLPRERDHPHRRAVAPAAVVAEHHVTLRVQPLQYPPSGAHVHSERVGELRRRARPDREQLHRAQRARHVPRLRR